MNGCIDSNQILCVDDTVLRCGINYQVITEAKFVETNCNAFTFINQGTSAATLDVCIVLAPGDSITFGGNRKEIYIHGFTVIFSPAGVNNLVMVRKFYSDFTSD